MSVIISRVFVLVECRAVFRPLLQMFVACKAYATPADRDDRRKFLNKTYIQEQGRQASSIITPLPCQRVSGWEPIGSNRRRSDSQRYFTGRRACVSANCHLPMERHKFNNIMRFPLTLLLCFSSTCATAVSGRSIAVSGTKDSFLDERAHP